MASGHHVGLDKQCRLIQTPRPTSPTGGARTAGVRPQWFWASLRGVRHREEELRRAFFSEALRAGAGRFGLRALSELAHLRRGGDRGERGCPVTRVRESHRRVRRGAAFQLRDQGRCGNRRAEIRREAEALRDVAPAKLARAEAVYIGVFGRGRMAEGDEAGGIRAQRTAAAAGSPASPVPLCASPLASGAITVSSLTSRGYTPLRVTRLAWYFLPVDAGF